MVYNNFLLPNNYIPNNYTITLKELYDSASSLGSLYQNRGSSSKGPNYVVFLRHSEKNISHNWHINEIGKTRAILLVGYIKKLQERIGNFDYIYTPIPDSRSMRPIQTSLPSSFILDIPIISRYARHDTKQAVKDILSFEDKNVLVFWGHEHIQEIALLMGFKIPCWNSLDFSTVVIIHYPTKEVNIECERLLPEDERECESYKKYTLQDNC